MRSPPTTSFPRLEGETDRALIYYNYSSLSVLFIILSIKIHCSIQAGSSVNTLPRPVSSLANYYTSGRLDKDELHLLNAYYWRAQHQVQHVFYPHIVFLQHCIEIPLEILNNERFLCSTLHVAMGKNRHMRGDPLLRGRAVTPICLLYLGKLASIVI